MALTILSTVDTNIGDQKSNLFCSIVFHTQELLITGKVQCELSFYISEAQKDAGADKIYPIVNTLKVSACEIQCVITDTIKSSGKSTLADVVSYFYNKVKDQLVSLYGWDIQIS